MSMSSHDEDDYEWPVLFWHQPHKLKLSHAANDVLVIRYKEPNPRIVTYSLGFWKKM
jgi:hypothetical protein